MAAASGSTVRSRYNMFKRLRMSSPQSQRASYATSRFQPAAARNPSADDEVREVIHKQIVSMAKERGIPVHAQLETEPVPIREPLNIAAVQSQPLRRPATHNIAVATLQLRSYNARHVEFMADFAMRAAYYLGLPAKGPVPLPRITERWTVPKSSFIFKKAQQNWERITMRRLVKIVDGDVDVVKRWLSFVRRWSWYGVGMKANVWEYEGVGVVERMDKDEAAVEKAVQGARWDLFAVPKGIDTDEGIAKFMEQQGFGLSGGAAPAAVATVPAPASKVKAKAKDTAEKPTRGRPRKAAEKEAPKVAA